MSQSINSQASATVAKAANAAEDVANDVADQVKASADKVRGAVEDSARKFASSASDIGGQVYQRGREAGAAVGHTIEERPFMVAALAGALGLLIGLALARR